MTDETRCPMCAEPSRGSEFKKKGFTYFRCPSCSHVFVSPQPSQQETDRYYQNAYPPDYLSQVRHWFQVLAKTRMDLIEDLFPAGFRGSVLDVGTGYGFFLDEAQRRGWKPLGIEPSEACSSVSTGEFHLEILMEDVERGLTDLGGQRFDVISFWHVLEHLENPAGALEMAIGHLAPAGILIVNSPNLDSAVYKILGRNWSWIYTPGHLQYFSLNSLTTWLQGKGLQTVKTETWTNAPTLYFQIEEGLLLKISDWLSRPRLLSPIGSRLKSYIYSPFHQQRVQQYLSKIYAITPSLDDYLKSRNLGHEFVVVGREPS